MKKRENNSTRASALQITLSIALLALSAIFFASSFRAAPPQQDGFYPALPVNSSLQQGQSSTSLLDGAREKRIPLPTDILNLPFPSSTIIMEPMTTSLIDPTTTGGAN